MKFAWLGLLLLACWFPARAQEIQGSIKDDLGNPVLIAMLTLRQTDSTGAILTHMLARRGEFRLSFSAPPESSVHLEVRANGFTPASRTFRLLPTDSVYAVSFVLLPFSDRQLEEVVIRTDKYPFSVKKDTVVFDAAAYSDATTRKVEDLIRKLPGVEVNAQTGQIKYKGRSVETVAIDGDNLFGKNYAIGTRNINVDIVEQIEAIEQYSDNPLLKGIENSDKVALNLKLKKGQADFSGGLEAAAGGSAQKKLVHNLNAHALMVAQKAKAFGSLASNNVGVNHGPFNYFSSAPTQEKLEEKEYLTEGVTNSSQFSGMFPQERSNLNNQRFGSLNTLFKPAERLVVRAAFYHLNDRISAIQLNESRNTVNGAQIDWFNEHTLTKRPELYRADLNTRWHSSASSMWEYDGKIRYERVRTASDVRTNTDPERLSTRLNQQEWQLSQRLLFTKRFSGQTAFQLRLVQSMHQVPQEFRIEPSVTAPELYTHDEQRTRTAKNLHEAKAILLGKAWMGRYTLALGANVANLPLTARLGHALPEGTPTVMSASDSLRYRKEQLFQSATYRLQWGRLSVATGWNLRYLAQHLTDSAGANTHRAGWLFEPNAALHLKLTEVSALMAKAGVTQNSLVEKYLYTAPLFTNNRTLVSNLPDLRVQRRTAYELFYIVNDLYNQFNLQWSAGYYRFSGGYFEQIGLSENLTTIRRFFADLPATEVNTRLSLSRFISPINTTAELKGQVSRLVYFNTLNSAELRENTALQYTAEGSLRTAFSFPVNFSNTFTYRRSSNQTASGQAFGNTAVSNAFMVYVVPAEGWLFSLWNEYYVPDTNRPRQRISLVDCSVSVKPAGKKYEAGIVFKNILNTDSFEQLEVSDFSTALLRANLLPRFLMGRVAVSF